MGKIKTRECQNVEYKSNWRDGFTPETLLEQRASRPRNRNIANAFFKAGFIDAWGVATRRFVKVSRAQDCPCQRQNQRMVV
ncbi:MAG: hypothetical protein IKS72_06035 [Prevotella sp.]|nr:hypothetical protein [Prevotella sp.]